MSRLYIILLGFVALAISSVGAVFSIVGLTHLFAGASFSVGLMAASLECAKLVVAGFLYRYWGHVNVIMRTYLSASVVVLSMITSMGVFGFLSHAYLQSSMDAKTQRMKINQLKAEQSSIEKQMAQNEKFIENIPASRISKRLEFYDKSRAQTRALTKRIDAIMNELRELEVKNFTAQSDIGPLLDVAETINVPVDTIARWLILLFVSVFDPLAICLVFAWGLAVRLHEKYRGDEKKIARLAISTPVDHRFKKNNVHTFRKRA